MALNNPPSPKIAVLTGEQFAQYWYKWLLSIKDNIEDVSVNGGVPSGGATGQFLNKNSAVDYDTQWVFLTDNTIEPLSTDITYNGDGTINAVTKDSVVQTYSYNGDGTINTINNGSWTKTFAYNGDGTIQSITVT